MSLAISRRHLIATPLALAGCATAGPYFGRTVPPRSRRLVHSNGEEPGTLDPAQSVGANSEIIIGMLLDSLTALNPVTLEPAAGLATHYEIDDRGTRYTFFLRGHPKPTGTRLPNRDSLPAQISRGRKAPSDRIPAVWSDNTVITAHDFVFSWRRFADPATTAPMAFYLAPIRTADARNPAALAVRAIDDFTFQFDLASPTASFVKLLWQPFLAAVHRPSIEARRSQRATQWTEPHDYVSSGPFVLREWKPYDHIALAKNPHYWEADSVDIEELIFLPVADGATNVNLYRTGMMHSMDPRLIPPPLVRALAQKKDFTTASALRTFWFLLNITTPPLNRLSVRYALNMATDKKAIARFLGCGQTPANGIVPPMRGYPPLSELRVPVNGRVIDILAFDPQVAREVLRAEGIAELSLSLTFPALPNIKDIAMILQQQWYEYAGVRLTLSEQGPAAWGQDMIEKRYRHLTQDSWTARCADPVDYLALFGPPEHYSTWTDTAFDQQFADANAMLDPADRMSALAACEAQLIKAMPVIPIYHDVWTYLEAPYIRGLRPNPFAAPQFKYAWIQTTWRPS
jgi:oligopeptide transport system substrate-binding protein